MYMVYVQRVFVYKLVGEALKLRLASLELGRQPEQRDSLTHDCTEYNTKYIIYTYYMYMYVHVCSYIPLRVTHAIYMYSEQYIYMYSEQLPTHMHICFTD